MSPHKQPCSLFQLCVKRSIRLINKACYVIQKKYPENQFQKRVEEATDLKRQLMMKLPASLFDVLCSERPCCQYRGDPRIQLQVLTHPNMTVVRRCDLDISIDTDFWIVTVRTLKRLVVLDLNFICTDDILKVIGKSCPLLKELNIVSRILHRNPNGKWVSVSLHRTVSDKGLYSIRNLKQLRILTMDAPQGHRSHRFGRYVSQAGIIMLISKLPYLEELRIESGDIGSTLIGSEMDIEPLTLRKIKNHFTSADDIKKLIKTCPFLNELSVKLMNSPEHKKDSNSNSNSNSLLHSCVHSVVTYAILKQISMSELRLNRLDLSFVSYSDSMQQLLTVKGSYLTHFSLWEIDHSLTFDAVLSLGRCCPNLITLCLTTQSKCLVIPSFFQRPNKIFSELRNLTIGNENHILTFFVECTDNLQRLVLKYQTKTNIDETLLYLLEKGHLRNVNYLRLDYTLEVSKDVVKRVIQMCERLQMFKVNFSGKTDVQKYINENNLDLKLGPFSLLEIW